MAGWRVRCSSRTRRGCSWSDSPPHHSPPSRSAEHAQIPRVRWDAAEVEGFFRRGEPVVLTGGCPLTSQLVGRWSLAYLSRAFGATRELHVHVVPSATRGFARHYGQGLGKGGVLAMSFGEFYAKVGAEHLAGATRPALWKYYLQTPLMWYDEERVAGGETVNKGPLKKAPFAAEVDADMATIDWAWLEQACTSGGIAPFRTCQLWAGHGGSCTPCHYDSLSNFLAQLEGRKHVLLFPPSQSFNLYPYPVGHEMDNFTIADPEAPDTARFPALAHARALETVLCPGDVLFLPRFYWHLVRQLDPGHANLSLNFWVGSKGTGGFMQQLRDKVVPQHVEPVVAPREGGPRPRDEKEAMVWLHAGRVLEAAAQKTVGAKAGLFLNAMAEAADAQWPPESAARVTATKLRQELGALLGGAAEVAALLEGLTRDGRLHPGLAPAVSGPIVTSEVDDAEAEGSHGKFRMTPPHLFTAMAAETDAELGLPAGTAAKSLLSVGADAVSSAGRTADSHVLS
ncbi:hypothetical protein AB1Y20_003639 [Prymnesium parvum]|uniref:JmjC domain-containing protein n=1 Tax=Prymnesium parvum TaxID=97485 RepID=A0AB34J5E2_PRYPA